MDDTGRPVKRARVMVLGGGRGGRTTMTDDQGRYQVTELTAGTYTVTGSKNGFVDTIYGQRRPQQPGTPVTIADAQAAAGIDLRLTRGGVITGAVLDEEGEALARALVTVQRYQYVQGQRQLTSAASDQTDDRGQYRVFGLPPGEYYVSATVGGLGQLIGRGLQQLAASGALGGRGGPGGGAGPGAGALAALAGMDQQESTGYAPTYYPGVVSTPEAGKVIVAPGQEVGGIDFQIQLVPLATVSGIVAGAADVVPVMLMPQEAGGTGSPGGQMLAGRSQADGTFAISNVPPGRYAAIARSGGRNEVTPLPFGGGGGGRGGPPGGGRAEQKGAFEIGNLLPGKHYIRVTGGGRGQGQGQTLGQWTLKSVLLAGQDVTDQAVDLKPGQKIDNVTVVLTDRSTEVAGTVRDSRNAPLTAITVIVFSSDPQYWRAQSLHIQAARTDTSGTFRLRGLPAGDYLIVAVEDVEQGEWFDPAYLEQARTGARHLTLSEGEKKTQDLRGPGAS